MKKSLTQLFLVISLCFLLCFSISCQNQEAKAELEEMKAQAEVEEQNKELVRQIYEAIDEKDFDKLQELSASDAVCHIPGVPEEVPYEAAIQVIQSFYKAFPDSTHVIQDMIAEGDKVAVRFIQDGTHSDEYEGIPPTGNKIKLEGIHIHRIIEGKITETWLVEDNLGMMMQLGMELRSKEAEK